MFTERERERERERKDTQSIGHGTERTKRAKRALAGEENQIT